MGIYKNLIFTTILFMLSDLAQSRPVSWAGGSTIMYRTNSMMSSYTFHYSPTYKYSIGAEYVNDRYFNKPFSYFDSYLSINDVPNCSTYS